MAPVNASTAATFRPAKMVGAADGWHNAGKESAIMAQKKYYSVAFQDEACKLVTDQGYTQQKAADKQAADEQKAAFRTRA